MQSDLSDDDEANGEATVLFEPATEIIPFDVATDDEVSIPQGLSLMGLSDVGYADYVAAEKKEMAGGLAAGGITIHAPTGPLPPAAGYSVFVVRLNPSPDGTHTRNDDIADRTAAGRWVAGPGLMMGPAGCQAHAMSIALAREPDKFGFDANFVLVNDGAGKTVEKYMVPRVAA